MSDISFKKMSSEYTLYSNILYLSRDKLFYTKFGLTDTFQNRINLIFFHISFIFIKINQFKEKNTYKDFYQKLFDTLFDQIELNMRELGYGDVTVNKNMKYLVKSFYQILFFCEKYEKNKDDNKRSFFKGYFKYINNNKTIFPDKLIKHFNDFKVYCFDLSPDSVLNGEIKFKIN